MPKITMLGSGLIGRVYTQAIHGRRSRDQVVMVQSRRADRARQFAQDWGIPRWTTDLKEAIHDPESTVVVIGLPNDQHEQAATLAAEAGKAVLCTKPLGRNTAEASRMLTAVEKAGVIHGYLEDLVYTPKTLRAVQSIQAGALGKVLWTRSRQAHSGPHSDWFWDPAVSGGGALLDMGCHCIEVGRNYIGKRIRPVDVFCWGGTQVHPIEAEDSVIGLVRYANGAIGQFEAGWTFRGGMDLRDEVGGTEGTLWLNHWQRTGFELFTVAGERGYVQEKAEGERGWLFPVGDEIVSLGHADMFADMLDSIDEGKAPQETFYDGYVVNAIMDAAYQSVKTGRWEPIEIEDWRGADGVEPSASQAEFDQDHYLIKKEKMPDGRTKFILKEKGSGKVIERVVD